MANRLHTRKLAVGEREAAALLSLTAAEFRELVEVGALPKPVLLGEKHERWSIADISAVLTGAKIDEDFET